MHNTSKRLSMPLLDNYSEVKNHGRVGQNCRLYNHYGSIGPPFGPEGGENIGKSFYLNLPDIGFTLITPIKGRIGSLTVYIY
jgi:hypothetical protein